MEPRVQKAAVKRHAASSNADSSSFSTASSTIPSASRPDSGPGGSWSRFLMLFLGVAFLFFFISSQSEEGIRTLSRKGGIFVNDHLPRSFVEDHWKAGSGIGGGGSSGSSSNGSSRSSSRRALLLARQRERFVRLDRAIAMLSRPLPDIDIDPDPLSASYFRLPPSSLGRRRRDHDAHKDTSTPSDPGIWAPVNGSFDLLLPSHPRMGYLQADISRSSLTRISLDAARFGVDAYIPGAPEPAASRGAPCPTFQYGTFYGFEDRIASCWQASIEDNGRVASARPANCFGSLAKSSICDQQPVDAIPHEAWSAQVLVLHGVYVNVAGQIFNETHYFDHNSCAGNQFAYRSRRVRVARFDNLVSMVDWYAWSARAFLLELLPTWVSLQSVLPVMDGVPVAFGHRMAHPRDQLQQMVAQGGEELLGIDLRRLNAHILRGTDLFYADRLIVPLHQRCGRPSRAMWRHLRAYFLAPAPASGGLPMFKSDYSTNISTNTSANGSNPTKPMSLEKDSEWIILLGVKANASQPFLEALQMQQKLRSNFPGHQVVLYRESSLSPVTRKKLINRAGLLVSAHDNLLADMVFMPAGGAVLDIRPQEEPDPSFRLLADVCDLRYYLLLSQGTKKIAGRKQRVELTLKGGEHMLDAILREIRRKLVVSSLMNPLPVATKQKLR